MPEIEEGPGMGAAYLAMTACGEFRTIFDCAEKFYRKKSEIFPKQELTAHYEAKYQKFRKIYPAIQNLYKDLK